MDYLAFEVVETRDDGFERFAVVIVSGAEDHETASDGLIAAVGVDG